MLAKANVNCRNYTKKYLNYVSVFIIRFTAFFLYWMFGISFVLYTAQTMSRFLSAKLGGMWMKSEIGQCSRTVIMYLFLQSTCD